MLDAIQLALRDESAHLRGRLMSRLYGRNPWRYEQDLADSQWWDKGQVEAWQLEKLQNLAEHAYRKVPFWQGRFDDIGWRPGQPMTFDIWQQVPPLTKQDMRTHGEALRAYGGRGIKVGTTSGTTGTPVRVWHDDNYWSYLRAVQRRSFSWYGVEPSSPTFYFGGAPHDLKGRLRRKLIDIAIMRQCAPAYDMSAEYLDGVIEQIRKFRPRIFCGYTSALFSLAQRASEAGTRLDDIGVKMVMPMSEMTRDVHIEMLRHVFGAPVMIEYGCVEVGAMAYTCPHGSIHPSHDHVVFEVVGDDGKPVGDGEVGRILLTPVITHAMPLIRYELGDMASIRGGECTCGRHRGMVLVNEIAGRTFDRMIDKNHKRWNGLLLYYSFKEVFDPAVFKEFQGRQSEVGKLHLHIVPGAAFVPERADEFARILTTRMGGAIDVTWEVTSALEREASAKLKYFKSDLDPSVLESAR